MKKHSFLRRFLTALALFGLLAVPQSAFAASDLPNNHWAASTINGYISRGIMSGYPDGTFRPEASVTRAEFVKMVNSVFGYNTPASISFGDVKSSYWGYNEIAKGVMAGYVNGDENGNFNPDAPLTREEAASIICRIKGLAPNQSAISNYIDSGRIATWAKPYVGAATQAGYMTGSGDGRFNPNKALTRAEAAAVLAKAESRQTSSNSGTYEPNNNVIHNTTSSSSNNSSSSSRVSDYTMSNNESTLSNKTITGNLYLPSGLGSKTVNLRNLTVDGTVYVRGGGTINVDDCDFNKVVLDKSGVRFETDSRCNVDRLEFWRNGTIEGQGYDNVIISDNSVSSATVNAKVENLLLDTDADLYLGRNARIDELEATSSSDDAVIRFNSNAEVDEMNIYDHIEIKGSGEINKMNCYSSGIYSSIRPNRVTTSGSGKRPTYTDDDDDDDDNSWGSSGNNNNNTTTTVKDLVVSGNVDGSSKKGNTSYDTVKVTNSGVTVKNIVVDKNLTIEASVGDGTVTFEHVTVKGQVYIHGGGQNSVIFSDCTLEKDVYIDKKPTNSIKQPMGLKLNNGTTLKGTIHITNNAHISTSPKEYQINNVVIDGTLTEPVLISANISKLSVESSSEVTLVLDDCTISSLSASSNKKITAKGKGNIEDISGVSNFEIPKKEGSEEKEEVNLPNLKPIIDISGVPSTIEAKAVVDLNTCQVKYADNSTGTITNATWTVSDDTANVTLSNNSLTAAQPGSFKLTATVANGKGIGEAYIQEFSPTNVTKEFVEVTDIVATIPPTYTLSETAKNEIALSATVKPENASNRTVVWSVTGGDGAKIEGSKLVLTGKGTYTVTATVNNAKADGSSVSKKFNIKVEAPYCPVGDIELTSLTYNETEKAYTAYAGSDFTLSAKVNPPKDKPNTTPSQSTIKWEIVRSDDKTLAISGNRISPKIPGQIVLKATVAGGKDNGAANYEQEIIINVKASLIGDIIVDPKQNSYYPGQTIELDLDSKIASQYKEHLEWSINNPEDLGRFMDETAISNLLSVNKQSKIATLTIPSNLPEKVTQIEVKVENKINNNPNPPSAVFYAVIADEPFVPVKEIKEKEANKQYSMTGGIQELSINLNDNVIVSPSTATFKDIIWSETIGEDENGNPLDNGTAKLNGNTLTVYEGGTYYVTATVKDGDLLNGKDKSQDFIIKVSVAPISPIEVTTTPLASDGSFYTGQKVSFTMDKSVLTQYAGKIDWTVDSTDITDKAYDETNQLFTFTIPADFTGNSITVTATNKEITDSKAETKEIQVTKFTEIKPADITINVPQNKLNLGATFELTTTPELSSINAITWELTGAKGSTSINSTTNELTIGKDEKASEILISATIANAKLNADKNTLESVKLASQKITINLGQVSLIEASPTAPLPDNTYYQGQKVTFKTDQAAPNFGTVKWSISNLEEIQKQITTTAPNIGETTGILTIPADFPTDKNLTIKVTASVNGVVKEDPVEIKVAEFKPVKDFSIAGTDGATSVEKGDSLQLISTIDPAQPSVNNGITWKITTSGIKTGTKIDENGNLTIAADETKTSITVQATLTTATITSGVLKDSSKSSNKLTITITTPPNSDTTTKASTFSLRNPGTMDEPGADNATNTITSTAKPATAIKLSGATSVEKGDSVQIKATVTPTNASNKDDIKWTISGNNKSGTTISSDGLLTVADNETAKTITVKATIGKVSNTIKITVKTPTVPERTNRELPNEAKDAISGGSRYPNKTVVRAD